MEEEKKKGEKKKKHSSLTEHVFLIYVVPKDNWQSSTISSRELVVAVYQSQMKEEEEEKKKGEKKKKHSSVMEHVFFYVSIGKIMAVFYDIDQENWQWQSTSPSRKPAIRYRWTGWVWGIIKQLKLKTAEDNKIWTNKWIWFCMGIERQILVGLRVQAFMWRNAQISGVTLRLYSWRWQDHRGNWRVFPCTYHGTLCQVGLTREVSITLFKYFGQSCVYVCDV